jgi:hypothetical protein
MAFEFTSRSQLIFNMQSRCWSGYCFPAFLSDGRRSVAELQFWHFATLEMEETTSALILRSQRPEKKRLLPHSGQDSLALSSSAKRKMS